MKTAFGIAIVLGTAAVFTLNAPEAEAGRNKHHHGHSYHSDKVPTYLMNNLDETAQDSGAPGTMWAGTGIPSTNFVLRRYGYSGIELAIKAHYRFGCDIPPTYVDDDGIVHIEVPAGPQVIDPDRCVTAAASNRAAWNFAYSYDVGINGSTKELDDYTGWLLIDVDPSKKTKYLPLRLAEVPLDTSVNEPNGYGWKLRNAVIIPDDEGTSQVTQNSQNLAFYSAFIDADPHTHGQQDYADTNFGPGQFDVIMMLEPKRRHRKTKAALHVAFDVVETEAP